MSARCKASCAIALLHYRFVTKPSAPLSLPLARSVDVDLDSTVAPDSIEIRSAADASSSRHHLPTSGRLQHRLRESESAAPATVSSLETRSIPGRRISATESLRACPGTQREA